MALSHDLAAIIWEDEDLGMLSAKAKNQLLLLKVVNVHQDGMRLGTDSWLQLVKLQLEGAVRLVDFDCIQEMFLPKQFGD